MMVIIMMVHDYDDSKKEDDYDNAHDSDIEDGDIMMVVIIIKMTISYMVMSMMKK